MQFKNGTDVAMLNACSNVIIGEKLYDSNMADLRRGFEQIADKRQDFTPEEMEPICGIPADTLREVAARLCPCRETPSSSGGMGVSQHTHGTDNAAA